MPSLSDCSHARNHYTQWCHRSNGGGCRHHQNLPGRVSGACYDPSNPRSSAASRTNADRRCYTRQCRCMAKRRMHRCWCRRQPHQGSRQQRLRRCHGTSQKVCPSDYRSKNITLSMNAALRLQNIIRTKARKSNRAKRAPQRCPFILPSPHPDAASAGAGGRDSSSNESPQSGS